MLFAALLVPAASAANIDVFGVRNNPLPLPGSPAAAYTANNYVKAHFATADSGLDGGLGTNVYVVHDDANLDGDGDPKTVKWVNTNSYFVRDKLFIPKGTTLTIEAGTKVYFSTDNNGTTGSSEKGDDAVGSITAARGGKLIADGTAAAPIVFTSDREWEATNNALSPISVDANIGPAPTSANAGLWGGIILLGQAYCSSINTTTSGVGINSGTVQIEGFAPTGSPNGDGDSAGIPDATQYGTSANYPRKDDDNSGIIRYVSIRHGGYEFSSGKEINGLTLGGVGSNTTIEFVEIYANLDDGIEFFGGRVNTNNIVVAFVQDDIFDIDEGYRGTNQFWFGIQNPGDTDAGGEWDGVGGTSSAGYSTISSDGTLHHAKPVIYNATIIGAGANNTKSKITDRSQAVHWEKGNAAFHFEDYINAEVYNSVYHDFSMGVIRFNDATSIGNNLVIENCTFGAFGTFTGAAATSNLDYITDNSGSEPYALIFETTFGEPINGNTDVGTDPMFTTYTRTSGDPVTTNASTNNYLTAINPVPAPGSPLLTAPISGGAPKKVTYRGAFGPEGNWAAGWTKLSQTGVLQGAAPAAPTFVDVDGDGIDDVLEATSDLVALGFSPSVNNVTNHGNVPGTSLFDALYTSSSIQDLRGSSMMIQYDGTGDVDLTLPLFKSSTLLPGSWTPAGNMTSTLTPVPGKQFYRVDVSSGVPNP